MPLESGYLLQDRYRIDRVLGHGGMGAVYLAADESLGIQCAVKENLNVSPDSERQFRREATLLASLRHPNLPRTTNHFILGGQQYLVMDYVEGEDLKERLSREHPLPEELALCWIYEICDALTYLHTRQPVIIHRDIKPANIKLTASQDAMLVDFGIAKATGTGQKTTTGAVALTPGYAPPEQYGMGRADPRTDEYALAATLYTLLTDHTPPDSMERLLGNVELVPPNQLRQDVSPTVNDAIMRALSVRPDARFASVADFKAALRGELPATPTIGPGMQPTVMAGAQPTVLHQAVGTRNVVSLAETRLAERVPGAEALPPVEKPQAGRPAWFVIAGLVVVLLVLVVGGGAAAAIIAPSLFPAPTATRAPTPTAAASTPVIIPTATILQPHPSATFVPPTVTVPPPPPPAATPVPATLAPATVAATLAPSFTPTAAPLIGGGGLIAFVSNRDGKFYQVYTMKPDGSDVKQLTTDARDKWSPTWQFHGTQLAWSPDGTRLLYVAPVTAGGTLNIWMIAADGSSPGQNISAAEPGRPSGNDYDPAWCKDGTIAFTTLRYNGVPQIATMTLDSPRPRNTSLLDRFGAPDPNEWNEAFFPQGCKRMLNVTVQNGLPEIWRVFPDIRSWRVFMTDIKGYNASAEEPVVSPDEKTLLYTRYSDKARDVIEAPINDSPTYMQLHAKQLTTTGNNFAPQWSPDGRWITFVSQRDSNREVYVMTTAGTDQQDISKNAADDVSPAWQPVALP
jgi:Tol biopolymer transport system component